MQTHCSSINLQLNLQEGVDLKKQKNAGTNHSFKKYNIKKWNSTLSSRSNTESLKGFILTSVPLDLSKYKSKCQEPVIEGPTSPNTIEERQAESKKLINKLADSLIDISEENFNKINLLPDTIVDKIVKNTLDLAMNQNKDEQEEENLNNNNYYNSYQRTESNPVFLEDNGNLKDGEYIYDDCIRIIKYISEGAQAKVYLGLIEEIEKYVAIKRYNLPNSDQVFVDKISEECEIFKNLSHENVITYFDVEFNETNDNIVYIFINPLV